MMEQLYHCDLVTAASLVGAGEDGVWVGRLLWLKQVYQGLNREQ